MATTPSTINVYNHDVVGIYNRLNRFTVELVKSVSSSVSQLNAFDRARLGTYIANIRSYVTWVIAQPQLDLPETTPRLWTLEVPVPPVSVENEEIDDIIRMLVLGREELTSSQSARFGSGLMGYDASRFTAIIDKVEQFLITYVDTVTPLDLPESSPTDPVSGHGSGGI